LGKPYSHVILKKKIFRNQEAKLHYYLFIDDGSKLKRGEGFVTFHLASRHVTNKYIDNRKKGKISKVLFHGGGGMASS
jgi:hypothetical protein